MNLEIKKNTSIFKLFLNKYLKRRRKNEVMVFRSFLWVDIRKINDTALTGDQIQVTESVPQQVVYGHVYQGESTDWLQPHLNLETYSPKIDKLFYNPYLAYFKWF